MTAIYMVCLQVLAKDCARQEKRAAKNPKVYYNPNTLRLFTEALDRAQEDVDAGAKWRVALTENFCGYILIDLLKTIGVC